MTDHAEVAVRLLGEAEKLGPEHAARNLAAAQVQAALAVAEQQRIANLIALAEHAHARFGNYAGEAGGMGTLLSYGETPESNMRIRDDVRKVLGLS